MSIYLYIFLFISLACFGQKKPNFLFCVMDDASIHMSAYGFDWVNTPAFDRIADQGILFLNAYTPNAKCAPSRSTLITGRNPWQLEEAANHVVNFPKKFKTFPEVLRDNGYLTAKTGKGWGPGNPGVKSDGNKRLLIGDSFNQIKAKPWAKGMSNEDYAANFDAFLNTNKDNNPWFFWYGAREPHRRYEYSSGQGIGSKKLSDINEVPLFLPDNDIVRNDMLDYALEIEYADSHLFKMIENLEKRGLIENTVIIITSDNGMPFPRAKAQIYEYSIHVPLAIMWPMGIKVHGRKVNDMISFIDFAPTILELAGISFETSGMHELTGTSLTDIFNSTKEGQVNPKRDYVIVGKERHDYSRPENKGYPIRGIVTNSFLYLYNYDISLWPAGNPEIGYLDIDGSPSKTEILRMFRSNEEDYYWKLSMGKRQTNKEFFDIENDPYCIQNLANSGTHKTIMNKLESTLEVALISQNDPRVLGDGDIFNSYGFSNNNAWNYYERYMSGEFSILDTNWVNPGDVELQALD